MITTPRNRRQGSERLALQMPVSYSTDWIDSQGLTLNVSESGARLVVRHPLPEQFSLKLGPVCVHAERVWEQSLGSDTRVVGVRFSRNSELKRWLAL